jgi:hypothetical protein
MPDEDDALRAARLRECDRSRDIMAAVGESLVCHPERDLLAFTADHPRDGRYESMASVVEEEARGTRQSRELRRYGRLREEIAGESMHEYERGSRPAWPEPGALEHVPVTRRERDEFHRFI